MIFITFELLFCPSITKQLSKAQIPQNTTLSKLTYLGKSKYDFCNPSGCAFETTLFCLMMVTSGWPLSLIKIQGIRWDSTNLVHLLTWHFTDQVFIPSWDGAFRPNFETSGPFFVSFNCDKEKSSRCAERYQFRCRLWPVSWWVLEIFSSVTLLLLSTLLMGLLLAHQRVSLFFCTLNEVVSVRGLSHVAALGFPAKLQFDP